MSRRSLGKRKSAVGIGSSTDVRRLAKAARILLVAVGSVSLALGVLGIFLPVLPTTPFLLLSSFCYMRSSQWAYTWLVNHRVLGEYIYFYTKHRAVRKRTRLIALVSLWAALVFSAVITELIYAKLAMLLFGAAVSFHLIRLRTVEDEVRLQEARKRDCSSR